MSAPSISSIFSPMQWQCPSCHQQFGTQRDNELTFRRGTCHHDICSDCIETQLDKLWRDANNGKHSSIIAVSCPLHGCISGKFHVGSTSNKGKYEHTSSSEHEVIDLCDDGSDDGVSSNNDLSLSHNLKSTGNVNSNQVPGFRGVSIKREQQTTPQNIKLDKNETTTPEFVADHSQGYDGNKNELTSNELVHLKPKFVAGDQVYAAWWQDKSRRGETEWYQGVIASSDPQSKFNGPFGPIYTYDIHFEDGDDIMNLDEQFVIHKDDYLLTDRNWIGVRNVVEKDQDCCDEWAKIVGWYAADVNGKEKTFARLSHALKAHDDCTVKKFGSQTDREELNIPENYPLLFHNEKAGGNAITPTPVKSMPGADIGFKDEPTDADSDGEESRFSERDRTINDDDEEPETREPKRQRTGGSSVATQPVIENEDFWSLKPDQVEFTEKAFITKSIFHLNSHVDSKKEENKGFADFIEKGIATMGHWPVPDSIIPQIANLSQDELRGRLKHDNDFGGASITDKRRQKGASLVAMWLKNPCPGSFIIMRHEYPNCCFCPDWLRDGNGGYIGPVYVIGVITKKILPSSIEEKEIQARMKNLRSNLCLVDWKRMGLKKNLKEGTRSYINKVCQPTVAKILKDPNNKYECGMTSREIRRDIWENSCLVNIPK